MSEISDTARRIINAGTPKSCVGCYYPIQQGIYLDDRVENGYITEVQATQALRKELTEQCLFGDHRTSLDKLCMYGIKNVGSNAPARARLRRPKPWE